MRTQNSIAKDLRGRMTETGKTQIGLAALLNSSRKRAGNIYHGRSPLTASELYAVAEWLGTTTDKLGNY